jgi:hypothetical protein
MPEGLARPIGHHHDAAGHPADFGLPSSMSTVQHEIIARFAFFVLFFLYRQWRPPGHWSLAVLVCGRRCPHGELPVMAEPDG